MEITFTIIIFYFIKKTASLIRFALIKAADVKAVLCLHFYIFIFMFYILRYIYYFYQIP